MAKGRKFTSNQSERFLGSSSYNNGRETVAGGSELQEDEVWSMVDNHLANGDWNSRAAVDGNASFSSHRSFRHPPTANHPQHRRQVGGLSLAFAESSKTSSTMVVHQIRGQDSVEVSPRGRYVATSAPVNVPDWSKIYRVDSFESMHDSDDGLEAGESELFPPHEYLARVYAGSRNNSVFEGVGRTLKGRDLSRVRDAVWSQTGFDEIYSNFFINKIGRKFGQRKCKMDIISQLQEQVNTIAAISFNIVGTLQRDAPPVRLSPNYPEPPKNASGTDETTNLADQPKTMSSELVKAAKQFDVLVAAIPLSDGDDEEAQLKRIVELQAENDAIGQELQKQLDAAEKELKQVQELFSQATDNCLNSKRPE
ncbi:unnamed protein product [Fraxinus pennsylvanica]|uniref:Mediator of RNA polymerase II transcription subunit 21 n=1 Tax=Fraxinus pennsylvanica TaxID=56036 RepID=A0AAD2E1N5_9LAMI|nr:unnamed protein product [Fraxinus pennsylvanica]